MGLQGTEVYRGPLHSALHLLTRILLRIAPGATVRYYKLVVQAVADAPRLPAKAGPRGTKVVNVTQAEYRTGWFPRPERIIASRFAQGAECFVAFTGSGEVAGCIWLIPGAYDEDEVRCKFLPAPEGEAAWDFDVFVHPRYRLGRTFIYLWDTANTWMRERGIRWTASRIDGFNIESLKAHRAMGAECVGSAYFICIGNNYQKTGDNGWQMAFLPDFPWIHCSRTSRPAVIVEPPHGDARRP